MVDQRTWISKLKKKKNLAHYHAIFFKLFLVDDNNQFSECLSVFFIKKKEKGGAKEEEEKEREEKIEYIAILSISIIHENFLFKLHCILDQNRNVFLSLHHNKKCLKSS